MLKSKMDIFFVRHGESDGNALKKAQNRETPMTKTGLGQAEIIADRIKSLKIDALYSSPYKRTSQTAEIISRKTGLEVNFWEDIREKKRPTRLEGLAWNDPVLLEISNIINTNWWKDPDWKYEDEESFNDLKGRAEKVLDKLLKNHMDHSVLLVSHAVFIRMAVAVAVFGGDLTPGIFWDLLNHTWHNNTGVTHLKFTEEKGWRLLTWNDDSHIS